jgi:hypothetical protein
VLRLATAPLVALRLHWYDRKHNALHLLDRRLLVRYVLYKEQVRALELARDLAHALDEFVTRDVLVVRIRADEYPPMGLSALVEVM